MTDKEVDGGTKQVAMIMASAEALQIDYDKVSEIGDRMIHIGVDVIDDVRYLVLASILATVYLTDVHPQFRSGVKKLLKFISDEIEVQKIEVPQ